LLAAGRHDKHDPVPFLGRLSDNPATGDALVVRMGMK
jgi:hypothetical protein